MLSQVLKRQFVLNLLDEVQSELTRPHDERGGGPASLLNDNSEADLFQTAHELEAARQRELAASSGQTGYDEDPDARRGEEAAPIDDTVFLSHDPIICNLQSAIEEYFEVHAPSLIDAASSTRDERRSDAFSAVTERRIIGCEVQDRVADGRRIFEKYSQTDPRWIASLLAMGTRRLRNPHPFNPKPADPVLISNNARLILVGDWGTGLPRAVDVSRRMEEAIEQGRAAGLEQHIIHLGDVYYSGWKGEYQRNFLAHWPVGDGEKSGLLDSWCLNGNHDMYSGGHAYFDYLLADPRFTRQQRSSFFSFRNDYWDILGLDTAYEDKGLRDPQAGWLTGLLTKSPRRSMLLSHHQLFSAYESPCEPLQRKIGNYLLQHPIDVWFWGHEHRCVFYREHQGVRNARLIGNGGVPVYMTHPKASEHKDPSFYEYREFIPSFLTKWAYLGFAIVDLDAAHANVKYVDECGNTFMNETL